MAKHHFDTFQENPSPSNGKSKGGVFNRLYKNEKKLTPGENDPHIIMGKTGYTSSTAYNSARNKPKVATPSGQTKFASGLGSAF